MEPEHEVYALRDPRSGETRYIGMAVNAERRLRVHHNDGTPAKRSWLAELGAAGLTPDLVVLQRIAGRQAARRTEREQIAAHLAAGAPLLNCSHGKVKPANGLSERRGSCECDYSNPRLARLYQGTFCARCGGAR